MTFKRKIQFGERAVVPLKPGIPRCQLSGDGNSLRILINAQELTILTELAENQTTMTAPAKRGVAWTGLAWLCLA